MEVEYKDGEWPEVVILMLTWAGPPELGISEERFANAKKTIEHLKKNFGYPNYSWHIADDGSPQEYQERVLALLKGEKYTFTDTKKGWDINNNWNTGMRVAFERADIVAFWPDDRFLNRGLNVRACVRLLMSYDDICCIRLNGGEPGLKGTPLSRAGAQWQLLDKKSLAAHVILFGPAIRHKRFIEHYGYFETDLWPLNRAENQTDSHFRHTKGPGIVCPEEFWGGFMPWGGHSTWELPKGGPFRKKSPKGEEQERERATIDATGAEETDGKSQSCHSPQDVAGSTGEKHSTEPTGEHQENAPVDQKVPPVS